MRKSKSESTLDATVVSAVGLNGAEEDISPLVTDEKYQKADKYVTSVYEEIFILLLYALTTTVRVTKTGKVASGAIKLKIDKVEMWVEYIQRYGLDSFIGFCEKAHSIENAKPYVLSAHALKVLINVASKYYGAKVLFLPPISVSKFLSPLTSGESVAYRKSCKTFFDFMVAQTTNLMHKEKEEQ